jgi:UDP-N-acetylmuramoyl-tripeptide--D-alanyl-D-alanine ligase
MNLTIGDVLEIPRVTARRAAGIAGKKFTGVSTDSRSVRRGELFVAIRGENFDGNRFVAEAFRRGAAAAVVDTPAGLKAAGRNPVVVVRDSTKALGAIARAYRVKFCVPVIAVAGSNGKTTTKGMIAKVLAEKFNVLSTEGNLNNHIGVPATIFRLRPSHDVAVVEVGTNHFGEVGRLARTALPTHGLITNVGREHLQFFRTIAGVAKAEGELFGHLAASGGTAFVNADDARVAGLAAKNATTVPYGFRGRGRTVRGGKLKISEKGLAEFTVRGRNGKPFGVKLSVPGRHTAANALAAVAVGLAFGVPPASIARALKEFRPVGKRMETLTVNGVTILNDTYNANPDSVLSALETLALFRGRGRRIVVLGDMLELGGNARREHELAGAEVRKRGFKHLLAFGPLAKHYVTAARTGKHYADKRRLAADLLPMARPGDVVLVKGSRGMRMEEIVSALAGGEGNTK